MRKNRGSFSAVSKPIFASKFSFRSIFQLEIDIHGERNTKEGEEMGKRRGRATVGAKDARVPRTRTCLQKNAALSAKEATISAWDARARARDVIIMHVEDVAMSANPKRAADATTDVSRTVRVKCGFRRFGSQEAA